MAEPASDSDNDFVTDSDNDCVTDSDSGHPQVAQAEGHVGSVACVGAAVAAGAWVCVVSCGAVDGLVKARASS